MRISDRACALLGAPSVIVESHGLCASDPYDEASNPSGYLNFGTAENHLMTEKLLEKINRPLELKREHIQYNPLHGSERLRESFSKFSQNYLNIKDLDPNNVSTQCGLSAVCESLSFALFENPRF